MRTTERIIAKVGQPGGGRWELVDGDGMGGFMDPPGALTHTLYVREWRGSRSECYETAMAIDSALSESYVPAVIKRAIRRELAKAEPPVADEAWIERTYAYYKNCYSPDGIDRNVSHCLIVAPTPDGFGYVVGTFGRDGWMENRPSPETHLAVLAIRKHFPDHEPRVDLIETPPVWGRK